MSDLPKIIYIDDEGINLNLFRLNFRAVFNVFLSESPEEALEIIQQEKIKVIITDYKMPAMNGMELIYAAQEIFPEAVCIILSAFLELDVTTDKSRVYKYMIKPYNKKEMIEIINEAFQEIQKSI